MDYIILSCYNDFVVEEKICPENTSSFRSLGVFVVVCIVCALSIVAMVRGVILRSDEEGPNSSSDMASENGDEVEEDDSGVAGISIKKGKDSVESHLLKEALGEEESVAQNNEKQENGNEEPGGSYTPPQLPVQTPTVVPILKPDPEVEEFASGFLTVHQKDVLEHGKEEYSFDPAQPKENDKNLSQYLTYVPPSNPYLNKTVMGFAPYWTLNSYDEFQMERLSIIAYFSVAVFPDGTFVTTCVNDYCGDKSGWDGWNSANLARMVEKAHESGVKVVLTIKNFDKSSIENLITSPIAQSTLIANIISEINAKNIDGVNIDYEYIGVASPELRAAFASSMNAIADAVHAARPGSHVSTDILGSSAMSPLLYDVTALGQTSLDAIMVMSYDFHSTRYYQGKYAAPTSPLFGNQYWYTVSKALLDIIARAPAGKVIMGVPYYGLEFPVSGDTWSAKNATVIGSGAITTYANVTNPVFDPWHNAATIQWDEGEKMTWYRYRWPNPVTGPEYWQGYYDDARSLRAKYDFAVQNGIGGVGIWALGYDSGRTELWNVLRDSFSKEPIVVLFKDGISSEQQLAVHQALSAEVVKPLANGRGVLVRPLSSETSLALAKRYNARPEVQQAGFLPYRSLRTLFEATKSSDGQDFGFVLGESDISL